MAGIAGITVKTHQVKQQDLTRSFASMMQKLSFSDTQRQKTFTGNNICFGSSVPVSCRQNDHFQQNNELGVHAVIDGLVFVDKNQRATLAGQYAIESDTSDYRLIPFLYHLYGQDFVKHITGWFNIFIYDKNRETALLINDRLGFLPLYYFDSDSYFIFASKIEGILATGLIPSVKADAVTLAEHLFFNYPVSDHTYIENIFTLSNAESIKIGSGRSIREKYWSISEFYVFKPAGKQESVQLMNEGLELALEKVLNRRESRFNFTLTGGWDSRVVLSYLLPEHKDKLHAYSFGAADAPDILIPQHISQSESLDYSPYILDQTYLDNEFMPNALKTIELSGGTRNYKRTHYLYAVRKITGISDLLITGIFGDEVFKVGLPAGGDVISKNTIDLLASDFDIDRTIKRFSDSCIVDLLNIDHEILKEAIISRLESLKQKMAEFDSISQKYCSFRFEYNLRKYFGNEAGSYNDFIYCFSPFIDYDFLKNFARTKYFGIHYPFDANSIRLKKQSTQLYHDIVQANYPPLTTYNSARGYSMKDANTLPGNLKILYQKYFKNRKGGDAFNTKPADTLFSTFLKTKRINSETLKMPDDDRARVNYSDLLSLIYWIGTIEKKYVG